VKRQEGGRPPADGLDDRPSCCAPGEAHQVERATYDDERATTAVLTDAFADYPFTSWIVPEAGRRDRLRGLFSLTVNRVGLPHGDTWIARCASGSVGVVGAVVGLAPGAVPGEVWSALAAEESALLGDRAGTAAEADRATAHLRPGEPHYTIATMGVASDHRRRGVATRLLDLALGRADALGLPCYLETSSTGNVALYSRSGFAVLDRVTLPGGGPPVWAMWRRPPGA
jgi:GNAT superfamily N-acetyltransferase